MDPNPTSCPQEQPDSLQIELTYRIGAISDELFFHRLFFNPQQETIETQELLMIQEYLDGIGTGGNLIGKVRMLEIYLGLSSDQVEQRKMLVELQHVQEEVCWEKKWCGIDQLQRRAMQLITMRAPFYKESVIIEFLEKLDKSFSSIDSDINIYYLLREIEAEKIVNFCFPTSVEEQKTFLLRYLNSLCTGSNHPNFSNEGFLALGATRDYLLMVDTEKDENAEAKLRFAAKVLGFQLEE